MNRDYIVVSVNGNKLENIKESTMDNIIAQIGGVLLNNSTIMPDDIIVTVTSERELMSSFVSKTFDDKKSKKGEDTKEDELALKYIKHLYINMYKKGVKLRNSVLLVIIVDKQKREVYNCKKYELK